MERRLATCAYSSNEGGAKRTCGTLTPACGLNVLHVPSRGRAASMFLVRELPPAPAGGPDQERRSRSPYSDFGGTSSERISEAKPGRGSGRGPSAGLRFGSGSAAGG